jgi:dihydropteroate synthase
MGIVNVTPDSFSDGGKFFQVDDAVDHALKLIDDGADIIDIGGESSRPGAESISESEELERIIPVIENILSINSNVIISVDTTKSKIAKIALDKGALIINDISSGIFDEKIFNVSASYNATIILMHIKGKPAIMQLDPTYDDVLNYVYIFLEERINIAKTTGLSQIIIDPGIGFGKTVEQNYTLLRGINKFNELGYPVLIGVSKKSFLGKTFDLDIDKREVPTVVSEAIAMMNGAKLIRTHNVKNAVYAKELLSLTGFKNV